MRVIPSKTAGTGHTAGTTETEHTALTVHTVHTALTEHTILTIHTAGTGMTAVTTGHKKRGLKNPLAPCCGCSSAEPQDKYSFILLTPLIGLI